LVQPLLQKLLASLDGYKRIRQNALAVILFLSIVSHLFGVALYYFLALSVGIDIPFSAMGWIRSAALIVALLPVSLSGLGLREGAIFYLLGSAGVLGEKALAVSLLVFGVSVVMLGALGGILEGKQFLFGPAARIGSRAVKRPWVDR
jgi:uncharacterized protein (TIRG00374 family)